MKYESRLIPRLILNTIININLKYLYIHKVQTINYIRIKMFVLTPKFPSDSII